MLTAAQFPNDIDALKALLLASDDRSWDYKRS